MKTSGVRVRCGQCDSVFRAGAPRPEDKYARILDADETNPAPAPVAPPSSLPPPINPATDAVSKRPRGYRVPTSTKEALPPSKWTQRSASTSPTTSSPRPSQAIQAPPDSLFPEEVGGDSGPPRPQSSLPPPIPSVLASSTPEELPREFPAEFPAAQATDDLFADLAPPIERGVSMPIAAEDDAPELITTGSNQGLDDLFPSMGASTSSPGLTPPPPEVLDNGRDPIFSDSLFINDAEPPSLSNSDVNRITSEFMEDMEDEDGAPPLVNDISMPAAETNEDGLALGKIQLSKARKNRDGSYEAVGPRPVSRSRSSMAGALDIPEPGHAWRALATFLVLVLGLLATVIVAAKPSFEQLSQPNVTWAKDSLADLYSKLSINPQRGPFKLVELTAEPYRLGPLEREVLMIHGRAVNTSSTAYEDVITLVNIVHKGASIRTTMSPLGLRLDDRALSQVMAKSELTDIWNQAKREAYEDNSRIALPGETREFVFVLWDLPPRIVQSSIQVAFRTGRGTLRK
jgi:hypothetical protein